MYTVVEMSKEVKEQLEGVRVYGCRLQLFPRTDGGHPDFNKKWEGIHHTWRGRTKADVGAEPYIAAYYNFYNKIGLNPKKNPPSVQNLLQRFFIREELEKVPSFHPAVDAVNAAALQHLIPLGIFDAACIEGQIYLTFTQGGELFQGLGEPQAEPLPAGLLVLADEQKVLSRFCYRDSEAQKVTPATEEVWLLGCQVPGVEETAVKEALQSASQILAQVYLCETA